MDDMSRLYLLLGLNATQVSSGIWRMLCTLMLWSTQVPKATISDKLNQFNYNKDDSTTITNFKNVLFQISPPVLLAVKSNKRISEFCRRDCEIYLNDLSELKLWAVKMYDSTGKFPSGLLDGNVHSNGNMKMCVNIEEKFAATNKRIQGKYCLATIFFKPVTENKNIQEILNHVHSFYAMKSDFEDDIHWLPNLSQITWGICIPSSCTNKDLEYLLETITAPYNHTTGLEIKLRVDSKHCETKRKLFTFPGWDRTILFLFSAVWVLSSIAIGINEKFFIKDSHSLRSKILNTFSLRQNWNLLKQPNTLVDDIECLHGIRAIAAIIIYFVHKYFFSLYAPTTNRTEMVKFSTSPWTMFFRAVFNYVDTFVMMSGFLTSYFAVKKLQSGKKLNILQMYMSKYLRYAPLLLLVVWAIHPSIFIFTGPTVLRVLKPHIDRCVSNYWRTVLFFGNFDGIEGMCYPPAHQLITDFQMYLIAPFLIIILWKYQKYAKQILFVILTVLTLTRLYTFYYGKHMTVLHFGIRLKHGVSWADTVYLNPFFRLVPYCFGIGLGWFMRTWEKPELSYKKRVIGWCVTLLCFHYSIFGISDASGPDYKYHPIKEALYGALQPITWCLGLSWIIFVCHFGYGGRVNQFLSWKGFFYFSKISYTFYICEVALMLAKLSLTDSPVDSKFIDIIDLNEIAIIVTVSVFLTVFFAFPIARLYFVFRGMPDPVQVKSVSNGVPHGINESKKDLSEVKEKNI